MRLTAWKCLAELGASLSNAAFELLLDQATGAIAPLDRLAAARAIARAELNASQVDRLVEVIPDAASVELLLLVKAVTHRGDTPDQSTSHPEVARRVKEVAQSLTAGDVEHGKEIFFSNLTNCNACHMANGQGGDTGPDLLQIGKIRERVDLLESILFPSNSIANSYETYLVTTTSGRTLQGVIVRADTRQLVLRDSLRRDVVIAHNEIEKATPTRTSIMPQGLESHLGRDQLSDLLAYLQSLGGE